MSGFLSSHMYVHIVGYTVGNLVLWRRASKALKLNFRPYIRRYTSPDENFEYGYRHFNALLQFYLKLDRCKLHKAARRPTKCGVINDVKQFPTLYPASCIAGYNVASSNQTPRYKTKCIRINCERYHPLIKMHS